MEKEMFIEIDKAEAAAVHAGVVTSKCHQIANGAVFMEEGGERIWKKVHDAKVQALDETLGETSSNSLIAYYFEPDLEVLAKKFPKFPIIAECKNQRQLDALLRDWNKGKHAGIFIHPQGAGHGLNMQDGGHSIIFYSLLFGHEPYRQVIERIGPARQVGRAVRVLCRHITARDTVDEALLAAQQRKYDNERGFIKAIKDYRDRKKVLDLLA
jgi:hypothetical protein